MCSWWTSKENTSTIYESHAKLQVVYNTISNGGHTCQRKCSGEPSAPYSPKCTFTLRFCNMPASKKWLEGCMASFNCFMDEYGLITFTCLSNWESFKILPVQKKPLKLWMILSRQLCWRVFQHWVIALLLWFLSMIPSLLIFNSMMTESIASRKAS